MAARSRCREINGLAVAAVGMSIAISASSAFMKEDCHMSRYRFIGLLLAVVLVPGLALAQPAQTGTISGVVKDESGAPMPGVSLTAVSQERGFTRTAVSDAGGRYLFPSVPIGTYTITAALTGFESRKLPDNLVETEKTTNVPVTLGVRSQAEVIEVIGEAPIVDITNTTANLRVRREEFDKLPVGRSYQALMGTVPGVVGTGNVNSMGALTANNVFLMDGIDTTDPTTGTFGTNLNFEAIQEVSVSTSGISAEYGRGVGAIVNVITKSGTNRFEGSAKYIAINDDWDSPNTTKSETTGASLARTKFDKVNPVYTFTLGGPIIKDRAWFFGAYERSTNTTPQRQTVGPIPEDYQQSTKSNFLNVRGTAQLTQNHAVWVKYFRSPTAGFVIDYWGAPGERSALTAQDQGANNWAVQWSGVLRSNWSMEASFGDYQPFINVDIFQEGRLNDNAPHASTADNKFYNGATFVGFVKRPRQQANLASTWFTSIGGNSHSIKVGVDYQRVKSGSQFDYPNRQYFVDASFDQATGTFVPQTRRDYESGDSTSKGNTYALYVRDKFQAGARLSLEAGLRYEKQTGDSDIGATTVDASTISPRLQAGFDLSGDGKTLLVASAARFYSGILQSFTDGFAAVPQQQNYKNYSWNGSEFVFSNEVKVGASNFKPNTGLNPEHVDELTFGVQRQFGRSMGAGVRFVYRNWGDLIDDVRTFNADGTVKREVVNYDPAQRSYRGLIFTFEKRFSNSWNTQASYTWSRNRGNHFATSFSALGDYIDAQCRTTVDTTVGTGGILPCSEVQDGANRFGSPTADRPHNLKVNGAYTRSFGRMKVVAGALYEATSKVTFSKLRTVNVLRPGTTANAGPTATYYYEPFGSERIDGLTWKIDTGFDLLWRLQSRTEAGFKAEVFNLTNNEEKIAQNSEVWCNTGTPAACATALSTWGKATARGSFRLPRSFRVSAILRF
jgi:hypothetical protein